MAGLFNSCRRHGELWVLRTSRLNSSKQCLRFTFHSLPNNYHIRNFDIWVASLTSYMKCVLHLYYSILPCCSHTKCYNLPIGLCCFVYAIVYVFCMRHLWELCPPKMYLIRCCGLVNPVAFICSSIISFSCTLWQTREFHKYRKADKKPLTTLYWMLRLANYVNICAFIGLALKTQDYDARRINGSVILTTSFSHVLPNLTSVLL